MVKCPKCGLENIEDKIEWNEEEGELEFTVDEAGTHATGYCPNCGREFHDQYLYEGIWDLENQEYVKRYN